MRVPRSKLVERMEHEIRPLVNKPVSEGGFKCCDKSTADVVLQRAENVTLARTSENEESVTY